MKITYNTILEIATEIVENDLIPTDNLIITYELEKINHEKLDEDLFYRFNKNNPEAKFEHTDVIEVNVAGVLFKFIQKDLDN
jgi:hypothetical protein